MARLVNDIRFYNLQEICEQAKIPRPTRPDFITPEFYFLDRRFALVLRSLKFDLGKHYGDVYNLMYNPSFPHGRVETNAELLRVFSFGVDIEIFTQMSDDSRYLFLADIIRKMLSHTASIQNLEVSKIEEAYQLIVSHGKNLEITGISQHTDEYNIFLKYTVSSTPQLLLVVQDIARQTEYKTVLYNLVQFEDCFQFCGRITMKSGTVKISTRSTTLARDTLKRLAPELKECGFIVTESYKCLEIPEAIWRNTSQ